VSLTTFVQRITVDERLQSLAAFLYGCDVAIFDFLIAEADPGFQVPRETFLGCFLPCCGLSYFLSSF
jgi:hypothetical protein